MCPFCNATNGGCKSSYKAEHKKNEMEIKIMTILFPIMMLVVIGITTYAATILLVDDGYIWR